MLQKWKKAIKMTVYRCTLDKAYYMIQKPPTNPQINYKSIGEYNYIYTFEYKEFSVRSQQCYDILYKLSRISASPYVFCIKLEKMFFCPLVESYV